MLRIIDIFLSVSAIILFSPLMVVVTFIVFLESRSPFFKQTRVGKNRKPFTLIKFRTMAVGTASVGTHLVDSSAVTPMGGFLRKTKLDELPQFWNVLTGDMSFVGPRPCLGNQVELVEERDRLGVFNVRPGITGLAQIMGIDMSTPKRLSAVDAELVNSLDVKMYFSCILQTLIGRGMGDKIRESENG